MRINVFGFVHLKGTKQNVNLTVEGNHSKLVKNVYLMMYLN